MADVSLDGRVSRKFSVIVDSSDKQCYCTGMETFKDVWIRLDPSEKLNMANDLESSTPYLSQLAHGHRRPSRLFGMAIAGIVKIKRETLFPGVFPPLIKTEIPHDSPKPRS